MEFKTDCKVTQNQPIGKISCTFLNHGQNTPQKMTAVKNYFHRRQKIFSLRTKNFFTVDKINFVYGANYTSLKYQSNRGLPTGYPEAPSQMTAFCHKSLSNPPNNPQKRGFSSPNIRVSAILKEGFAYLKCAFGPDNLSLHLQCDLYSPIY